MGNPLQSTDTINAGDTFSFWITAACGLWQGPADSDISAAFASFAPDITIVSVSAATGDAIPGYVSKNVVAQAVQPKSAGLYRADCLNAITSLNTRFALPVLFGCEGFGLGGAGLFSKSSAAPGGDSGSLYGGNYDPSKEPTFQWSTALTIIGIAIIGLVALIGFKEVRSAV